MTSDIKQQKNKRPHSSALPVCLREGALLTVGGLSYYALEVAFRGYSHWSMAICGGICLQSIYHMNKKLSQKSICLRALLGASLITAVELVCGILVNLTFQMRVWDYSHLPLNLWGQICLPFSLLWAILCLPVCAICTFIDTGRFYSRKDTTRRARS